MRRTSLFLFYLLIISLCTYAQGVNIEVNAPKSVAVGELFRVCYSLDFQVASSDDIKFSSVGDGLDIVMGPSVSKETSIVNGKMSYRTNYNYVFSPSRAGTFDLPRLTIKHEGKKYTSEALSINVLSGKQNGSSTRASSQSGSTKDEDETEKSTVFLRTVLSKQSAYENEGILAVIKLYTDTEIGQLNDWEFPAFEGFMKRQAVLLSEIYPEKELYNNRLYNVYTIAQDIVFPLYQDTLTVESAEVNVEIIKRSKKKKIRALFDNFFAPSKVEKEEVQIKSPALSVVVKPFPAGAPALFNGAVGNFKMSAQIDTTHLALGDSIKVRVEVSGTGNIDFLHVPSIIASEDIQVIEGETKVNVKTNLKGVTGTRTVEYIVIPDRRGDYNLQVPGLAYLDPKLNSYQQTEDIHLSLSVEGNKTETGEVELKEPVETPASPDTLSSKKLIYYISVALLILLFVVYMGRLHRSVRACKEEHKKVKCPHVLFIGGMLLLLICIVLTFSTTDSDNLSLADDQPKDVVVIKKGIQTSMVYAVDVSSTMLALDFKPNRLAVIKEILESDGVQGKNVSVGLVAFASEGRVACPLTQERDVFSRALTRIDSLKIEDGTAIGTGILVAANTLVQKDKGRKYIVLFTDGTNTLGGIAPHTAARIARLHDVRLYIVGIGHSKEASCPVTSRKGTTQYLKIPTKIDQELYTEMAQSTGGEFYRVTNMEELKAVCPQINDHIKAYAAEELSAYNGKLTKEKAELLMKAAAASSFK